MPLWEFLDWNRIAVPAGGIALFGITYYVATKLANWKNQIQTDELRAELKAEKESHAAARQTVKMLELQQVTFTANVDKLTHSLAHCEQSFNDKKQSYHRLLRAAHKVYLESEAIKQSLNDFESLRRAHAISLEKIKALEDDSIGQDTKLKELRDELDGRELSLKQAERRMRKAMKLKGYLLVARANATRPAFKPLADRKRAIIAVGALKGGVGKTTVTAHLAGAFARRGYRVLLVDLDLQGSLSGLMLPPGELQECYRNKRLLQDFFETAMGDKRRRLSDYILRSPASDGCPGSIHIVPTSDRLAYAEMSLTLKWLLKRGERDARFLLRKALHLIGANADFDIVLLDCPPVLNMSCANALAAADYLLMPTLLTGLSTERVVHLVKAVQQESVARHLNGQLRILGVLANRARQVPLNGQDLVNWEVNLPKSLAAVQNAKVKRFTTIVGSAAEISKHEEQYRHPAPTERAFEMFAQLAMEIEQELPDDCRRA